MISKQTSGTFSIRNDSFFPGFSYECLPVLSTRLEITILATSRDGNVFVADSRGDVEEVVFTHTETKGSLLIGH